MGVVKVTVTEQQFKKFMKYRRFKRVQGCAFHSENFLDLKTNEVIGYRETSSWNPDIIYQIEIKAREITFTDKIYWFLNKLKWKK
jgi:hypothetical protein